MLFALFPIFHLVIGVLMITGSFVQKTPDLILPIMGWFFTLFALTWILCGLAFSVCMALAGRFLARQTHYTFCLVMAALACSFMPFGTVLGVFTIITLLQDSVKAMFAHDISISDQLPPEPTP
jgi:hypothetical protein